MPPDLAPHICPECAKRFGKAVKLEQHLLEAHHFELRLSPTRDEPLSQALAAAVAEANAAFAAAQNFASCPRCPPQTKEFRNARALAQHLVIKHLDHNDMASAVAKVEPAEVSSEISFNPRKRKIEGDGGDLKRIKSEEGKVSRTDQTGNAGVPISSTDSGNALNERKETANVEKQTTAPAKSSGSPAKGKTNAPKAAVTKVKPKTTAVKAADAAKEKAGRRHSTPANMGTAASSGSKPPVTPKKPAKSKVVADKAASKDPKAVPWISSPAVRIPAPAAITTAPMDFSGIGGFAANSRKSYYRLTNR